MAITGILGQGIVFSTLAPYNGNKPKFRVHVSLLKRYHNNIIIIICILQLKLR